MDPEANFVCSECAHRQAEGGVCQACGFEGVHDLRSPETRLYLEDVAYRAAIRRENRFRWIGVVAGMLIVFGLWLIPGFWDLRRKAFAIPMLLDQLALMAVIAYGIGKLLDKVFHKPSPFAFLDEGANSDDR